MSDLEIDLMLFYAAVIEEQIEVLAMTAQMGDVFGDNDISKGVADICREQLTMAQTSLDELIAEDTTWRPL